MERKEEQETCPAHILAYKRGLITKNNNTESEVGVANDLIFEAQTYTNKQKEKNTQRKGHRHEGQVHLCPHLEQFPQSSTPWKDLLSFSKKY